MKRLLPICAALIILAGGAVSFVATAHAQTSTQSGDGIQLQQVTGQVQTVNADGSIATQGQSSTPGGSVGANNPSTFGPMAWDTSTYGGIMTSIMSLFAWLMGAAAVVLDYAAYYTVVTMGHYVNDLSAVGVAWRILRDIGNIVLIFGFLAIGISVILDINIYGWGQKALPKLLLAALLLNFSLFITEAVIDAGNLFATQFYVQINGGQLIGPEQLNASGAIQSEGISNRIMQQLGLVALYGEVKNNNNLLGKDSPWYIGFLGIILFLIAAFVMFSLAFILIARFVALIFLIIIAPIGFAGLAVPKLEKVANQWWGTLFEQAITAPILFLLLYVALAVITDASFLTGLAAPGAPTAQWTGFANGNLDGFAQLMLSFLVAMGLLLAVTMLSKRIGAAGAGLATKLGGMASFGAVSLAGRATLGVAGNALTNKRMMAKARTNYLARGLVFAGRGLRSSTYDARNIPGASAGLSALGINAGKGAKFTAKQAHEAQYGMKPVKKWLAESEQEYQAAGREVDFKKAQSELQRIEYEFGNGQMTAANYKVEKEKNEKIIAGTLAKMSTKELEVLGGIKKGVGALVENLSPQQFESLLKSDKLTDAEKGNIKNARYRPLQAAISSGTPQQVKEVLDKFSKGELEAVPSDMLSEPVMLGQLSDKQRDTLTDSKERTAAEKAAVRSNSASGKVEAIFAAAGGGAAGGAAAVAPGVFDQLTTPQIVKLKKEILLQPAVAGKLTTNTLAKLAEENKFTPAEMQRVGLIIRSTPGADPKTLAYITTGPGASFW